MKYAKLKWALLNDVLVSFATEGSLDPKVWNDLITDLSSKSVRKYLVTTIGSGELTSVQRKQIADLFSKKRIGVAVVTDQKIIQHMVTAISWLGVDIKAFSWNELRQAVRHLGVAAGFEDRMVETVHELKRACTTAER